MGGAVAMVVREPDGRVWKGIRWTNGLSWMVTHLAMVKKDPKHVRDSMDRPHYGTEEGDAKARIDVELAPDGYGLVLVDLMNDRVLSMQGYTNVSQRYLMGVLMDLDAVPVGRWTGFRKGPRTAEEIQDWIKRMRESGDPARVALEPVLLADFLEDGRSIRVTKWQEDGTDKGSFVEVGVIRSVPEFAAFLAEKVEERPIGMNLVPDMSPLVFEDFEEDADGARAMLQRIRELGFELSEADEASWAEWIAAKVRGYGEDEDEDEEEDGEDPADVPDGAD